MIESLNITEFNKKIYNLQDAVHADTLEFLGDKPALVDFYASWCGPCKTLEKILVEINKEYNEKLNIYKINIEEDQELATIFGISGIPTLLFIPLEGNPGMTPGLPATEDIIKKIEEMI
tara:strand:+ start:110 stop:466 length:357 start_codon:yes stop_codon:yes gene_type:complete